VRYLVYDYGVIAWYRGSSTADVIHRACQCTNVALTPAHGPLTITDWNLLFSGVAAATL
jgi:hypothetical protein